MNQFTETLNDDIRNNNPAVYELLSQRGRAVYFPYQGIIAQAAEAKGTTIDASIGIAVEDDGSPMRLPAISDAIALDPKQAFPYASSFGLQPLRERWLELIKQKNPALQTPTTMPVVTAALTHGLYLTGYLFVNENDEVLVTDKYWENYGLMYEQGFGGTLKTFNTFTKNGFDSEALRHALATGTSPKKILVLNFPNNPAGYTPTKPEVDRIVQILKESAEAGNRIAVILDDAYFGLTYDETAYPQSLFAHLADLHSNIVAVKIDGATKEDYAWGLRVGFITFAYKGMNEAAAKALEAKTGGAVRGTISNAPNISQHLVLKAMQDPNYTETKHQKYATLKQRYDMVKQTLTDPKFSEVFTALPYNSGYFMCIQFRDGLEADVIRKRLISEHGIGTIAVDNLLRIAYSGVPAVKIPSVFEAIYQIGKH